MGGETGLDQGEAAAFLPVVNAALLESDSSQANALRRWEGDPRFMLSLARGLLALGVVVRGAGAPVSTRQVAAATGLSPAAALRCVYTLHELGYVQANRNGAVPGPAMGELANAYAASSPLISGSGPVLDALHQELGVTVSLAMFDGGSPLIVASRASEAILRLDSVTGAAIPLHCTSSGKVYLASLADELLDRRLAQIDYVAHTPRTIIDPVKLRAQVLTARRHGFAMAEQELVIGIRSASVPVRGSQGRAQAALSATMLTPAVSLREVKSRIIPSLLRAAEALSRLLT